jgi:hypothetical protein
VIEPDLIAYQNRLIEPESAAVCRSVREARWAGSRTACRSRW